MSEPAATKPQPLPIKSEVGVTENSADESSKRPQISKVVVLADLNVDPPETDDDDSLHVSAPDLTRIGIIGDQYSSSSYGRDETEIITAKLTNDDSSQDKSTLVSKDTDMVDGEGKRLNKLGKPRSRVTKVEYPLDYGADADADQHGQGAPTSREEKVSSLKTGLVHVARKMPKNAHAHFILGLMYQRLGQPQKAVSAYEKAAEILLRCEEEIDRPELLSLVQIHHAQCLLLGSSGDHSADKELEPEELEEILLKMKDSMQSDIRQAAVWNTLGLILLRTGRLQNAISVLSSLLTIAPDNLDCLGNLGIAYLRRKMFSEFDLKDQNHPAALINYAAVLMCKYGSIIAGASEDQLVAANVAKECLLAAVKVEPKAAHVWANLANAYYLMGDCRSSSKCFEKAAKLEPNCMSTRYAVAVHQIKDAERYQDPSEQISWAGNEMASILREGDSALIEHPIAWAGLAMVHKIQNEIAAAFETEHKGLMEMEERAVHILKQASKQNALKVPSKNEGHNPGLILRATSGAIAEDPDDAVQWHQLGLHNLCVQQFKTSQKYLKAAVARSKECSYMWSNLGISLQLSEEPAQAEQVYKRALSLVTPQQAHTIFSNLGNLYRQQKKYQSAKAMFTKSLELQPGYAPAYNNLGLVFIAEGRWKEAEFCFNKALQADPLLDAAKSNMIKAAAMSRVCQHLSSCSLQD
ncbi:UDP-N-acetylglucosamine--peptide N-acetylglucosaminyltransferase 110 kDa subunit [Vitis vinifera]|uniref:UDP-N-acetylglucosamine--peptide N-acetylglucosaminyltransferase 110 kDa subunit n=1 Tax=Vitis vinifera TaxID=29760 RepID=A0A438BQY5_VITVI|nr:UDP-N-acetylglucosamine--peptide N-acetylglucosaminyltransferase 110 kDa subunit [Vitis vinifera]